MTRISRTARVKAERIQSSYVNRLTEAGGVHKVQQIQRIEDLKNSTNHPSENQLLSYERYYQTLREAKKEFVTYYNLEKELYEAIINLDKKDQELFIQLNKFIQKYNKALHSLKNFDQLAGTEHLMKVHEQFLAFSEDFCLIGIQSKRNQTLSCNPHQLQEAISHSGDFVFDLVQRFKNSVLKQYQTLIQSKSQTSQSSPYDLHPLEIKGLIVEEEG